MATPLHKWQMRFKEAYGVKIGRWERERFLAHCNIEGDCWVWQGPDMWAIEGARYEPARVGFLFLKGTLARNQSVGTTCGKVCCCPDHMYCFTASSARVGSTCR